MNKENKPTNKQPIIDKYGLTFEAMKNLNDIMTFIEFAKRLSNDKK